MPPREAGTTSPSPVAHSTSVSWAMATSSSRGSPPPSASSSASAVLRAAACPGQNASPADTMQDGPPHPLRGERLRSLERLRVTFAVEDRDGGRVSLDLRYVVGHDEVQIRFLRKRHRPGLELRLADPGFGLEPDEGLPCALAESPKQFGGGL